METDRSKFLENAFNASLFETFTLRRSKRFPLGGAIHARRGGMQYASEEKPLALTDIETAILCFSASGITGRTVEETRHLLGHITPIGRVIPSPCASLTHHLLFTNDSGTYYYKADKVEEVLPKQALRFKNPEDRVKIVDDFHKRTIQLSEGRLPIPREVIGSAFEPLVNLAGTTLFIPIADASREYINLLFTGLAQFRWRLWDEVKDQPAGVGRWIDSGFLNGPRISIFQYDSMLPCLTNLEAGMALQNLSLAAVALGLGSFLMHTVDLMTVMNLINMKLDMPEKNFPESTLNPVGIPGVLEGFCPPFKTIDEAVDEIAALKWGQDGFYGRKGYDIPCPKWYKDITECVNAFCNYIWENYNRFPKYANAMHIPALLQVHHIDPGFYSTYFSDYSTDAERNHIKTWHEQKQ